MITRSAAGGFGCRKTALVLVLAALVLTLLRVLPVGPPIVFADEYLYAAWTNYMHAGLGRPARRSHYQGVGGLRAFVRRR